MEKVAKTSELTAELKIKIEERKSQLVNLLQEYSLSQIKLWQQVPELAKEANKLSRFYSNRLQMASDSYLWSIDPRFLYGLQVDLRTGEIQSGRGGSWSDDIALGNIDSILARLDAAEIIKLLEKKIRIL